MNQDSNKEPNNVNYHPSIVNQLRKIYLDQKRREEEIDNKNKRLKKFQLFCCS